MKANFVLFVFVRTVRALTAHWIAFLTTCPDTPMPAFRAARRAIV